MRNIRMARIIVAIAFAIGCGASAASAQTSHRPIQDWITPNLSAGPIYWFDSSDPQSPLIFFDYFGANNASFSLNLGTSLDGTITETAQNDGTARVHVVLHSQNVLTWAYSTGFAALIFGHTPAQVKTGGDAALGDTVLTVDFTNSAPGAPLPSLFALSFTPSPNYSLGKLALVANAQGTVRAAFGAPDGTPAAAHTTQRGLDNVPGLPNNGQDTFPAEHVDIHIIR